MKIPTKSLELYLENWREHCETGCHVTFLVTNEDLDYFRMATLKKGKIAGQRYACVLVELAADETPAAENKPEPPKPPKPEGKEAKAAREQAEFNAKTGDLLAVIPPGSEPLGVAFEAQPDGSFARTIQADDGVAVVAALKGEVGFFEGVTFRQSESDKAFDQPHKGQGFPAGLAGLAVRWCLDPHFQEWLSVYFTKQYDKGIADGAKDDEAIAKAVICSVCGIKSRTELDTDEIAGNTFRLSILEPYAKRRAADEVDEDSSEPDDLSDDSAPPF